jgi:hypothetical protein
MYGVAIVESASHYSTRSVPLYESRIFAKDENRKYVCAELRCELCCSVGRYLA